MHAGAATAAEGEQAAAPQGARALAVSVSVNMRTMRVYLVGGAVRDRLLGRPVQRPRLGGGRARHPGAHASATCRSGASSPCSCIPTTHEEYALARPERKVAPGYRGFTTQFAPDVTLEDDLRRRDLTINAMAEEEDGTLIDPYGGQADLAAHVLRHVSEAFAEDPVRILRVARFAARYADLGFRVAPETLELMRRMIAAGEVRTRWCPSASGRRPRAPSMEEQPRACSSRCCATAARWR